MKTNLLKTALALIACLLLHDAATAQISLQIPLNADRVWTSSSTTISGLNTAMIDIDTADHAGIADLDRLAACAFFGAGGANPGGIVVTDLTHNYSVNVNYPVGGPGTMASTPDIIIGNNVNSATPNEDFIMAVTFINTNNDPEIDFFDIHYSTPWTVFTVTYHNSIIIPYSGLYTTSWGTIHMDVMADRVTAPLYGNYPVCDTFFVVFDAAWGAPDIFANYGTLGTYGLVGTTTVVTTTVHYFDNVEPDVAAIQYRLPGGARHSQAIITWANQGYGEFYDVRWAPAAGTFFGGIYPDPYDPIISNYDGFYHTPRIDADDNYLTNDTTGATHAVYKIAVQYNHSQTTQTEVRTVDNTLRYSGEYITSNLMGGAFKTYVSCPAIQYNCYLPVVAYGPNAGKQYMVSQYGEGPCSPNNDCIVMDPIDKSAPTTFALDPPPATTNSYFPIDFTISRNADSSTCDFANSTSTPCNNVSDTCLIAWAFYDAGSTTYFIDFKTTVYDAGTLHGYNYREADPTSVVSSSIALQAVSVFPNPADDFITVSCSAEGADRYCITDVLGHEAASGKLAIDKTTVPVGGLSPGGYIISLYRQQEACGRQVFVKE